MKTKMNLELGPLSQQESLDLFDQLANGYTFASSNVQEARDHISAKQEWLPGEIEDIVGAIHNKPIHTTTTKSRSVAMVTSSRSRDDSFMLAADALQIEHGDKPQYWRIFTNPSTSTMEAKLIKVWFLHIEGKVREDWLWASTSYGAYLVYKMMPDAYGFRESRVEFIVSESSKSCFLDPAKAASLHKQRLIEDSDMPKTREDEWLEIEMGSFYNDGLSNPEVNLIAKDHNTAIAKSGLCIRGIELRPLDQK